MLSTGKPALDAVLAEAVTASTRHPQWKLTAAVPPPHSDLSPLLEDATVERALIGDLPPETSLVEGYASASLTLVLGGTLDGTSAVEILAPAPGNRDWTGVAITFDAGLRTDLGPAMPRQFTGVIRSVEINAETGTVKVVAADHAELLRAGITLYATGLGGDPALNTGKGYGWSTNTQWLIDHVLRRNGIYNSPAPMPGALLSVTGHGSLIPEVGFGGQPRTGTGSFTGPWWIPGPDGMLAINGGGSIPPAVTNNVCAGPVGFKPGTGLGMALFVHTGATAPLGGGANPAPLMQVDGAELLYARLNLHAGGGLTVVVRDGTREYTVACPPALALTATTWHFVGVHLAFTGTTTATTLTVTWNLNGNIVPSAPVTILITTLETPAAFAGVFATRPLSGVQAWSAPAPPAAAAWPRALPPKAADIDTGLNELTYLPRLVGVDSWSLLTEVAAAEFGAVGFSETGRFFFRNRTTLAAARNTPPIGTLTASTLKGLSVTSSLDAVRNEITLSATSSVVGPWDVLIDAEYVDQFTAPANGLVPYTIGLPEGCVDMATGLLGKVTSSAWGSGVTVGFCAVNANNPTAEAAGNVFVYAQRINAETALILVQNQNTFPIRLSTTTTATANPQPALRVPGNRLVAQKTQHDTLTHPGSITVHKRRSLSLPSGPWRQLLAPFRPLAQSLLTELATPRPVIDRIPAVGDPRRTLADNVVLDHPALGVRPASIVAITRHLSPTDGLTDLLTVRPHT